MTGTPLGATPEKPLLEKKVEEKKEDKDREQDREKNLVFAQAQVILREHGNQESNIPVPHIYWELMNRFRTLARPLP